MLITFSGLDGSGKSTLIGYLKESLEKDNQKVAVSHMNYDVGIYSAVRFLVQKTIGRTNERANGNARTHGPRELRREGKFRTGAAKLRYRLVWNKSLRFLIYPLDVLIFVLYRFYIERVNQQVLIMDRYFYDTLIDVTGTEAAYRRRFLSWLTPSPNLSVYLDVSPEEAFARKPEYSVDYLNQRRRSYQKLIAELPRVLVLSTDQDLDSTRLRLTRALRERMVIG